MKKQDLIEYLGGTAISAAKALGYTGHRCENNIYHWPDDLNTLTQKQRNALVLRMKAARIKVPKGLIDLR